MYKAWEWTGIMRMAWIKRWGGGQIESFWHLHYVWAVGEGGVKGIQRHQSWVIRRSWFRSQKQGIQESENTKGKGIDPVSGVLSLRLDILIHRQLEMGEVKRRRHDTSVQFSRSVMSNSLWPHGLQHTRPCCPSPTPRVYSNSCPLSRWCQPTISSSVSPSPPAFNLSQNQGLFQWSVLLIRWPKYWSFSFNISLSNEYSGLISLRI